MPKRVNPIPEGFRGARMFATHIEDVTPQEMQARYEAMLKQGGK